MAIEMANEKGKESVHLETINVPGVETIKVAYTGHDAQRVRRKLDFWLMPILMITYGLQ
jgi:hypothetical protein